MKIALISPNYPSDTSSSFAFVHARAKLYLKYGYEVQAYVLSPRQQIYSFEGVPVKKCLSKELVDQVSAFSPDVLAVHYPTTNMFQLLKELDYPKVTWIHGHEILWTLNLMPAKGMLDWIKKRVVLFPRLIYQILSIREFLKDNPHCVFVSKWMQKAAEKHTQICYSDAVVIPNPVDTDLFAYREPKELIKGISVRSLELNKYGLDLAISAFSQLTDASLTIYGTGRYYHKFQRMIKKYHSNVCIKNMNISHNKLPHVYHQHGFFVAPSRWESQGLAMCEAMACGLPVVATKVGGIPEFVRHKKDGFLVAPKEPKELRTAIINLVSDKSRFLDFSMNARKHIEQTCSAEVVTEREINIMKKSISSSGKA